MNTTPAADTTTTTATMDTRERILYETWRMIERRRGQIVRLEDIAKAAGVSRQAVYLHFGSRAELFIQTLRYVDDRFSLSERIREVCEAASGEAIEAYITWWASYIPDIYQLAKAILQLRETDQAAAAAWDDRMRALRDGCVSIMESIAGDGALAPDWTIEQASDFFWALLSIDTWERLTIDRGWPKEQYIEQLRLVVKHALTRLP